MHSVASIILILTINAQAYWIDPQSCAGSDSTVQSGMDTAFATGQAAAAALHDPPNDQNKKDLATYIFNTDAQKTEAQKRLQKTGGFAWSRRSSTKDSILVFCDERRYQEAFPNFNPQAVDPVAEMGPFSFTPQQGQCTAATSAYTLYSTEPPDPWQTIPFTQRSAITFCPGYLTAFGIAKFKSWKAIPQTVLAVMQNTGNAIWAKFGYKPIDGAALFDETCLHELMHTSAMATSSNAGDGDGKYSGYGWKDIRALAILGKGAENADSLAYYGLGIQLINAGYRVNEDGTLKRLPGSRKRDDLVQRWRV